MPIGYLLDRPQRRLNVTWQPPVTLQELIDLASRQASDGAWQYGIFGDLRAQPTFPREMARPLIEHIMELNAIHGRRGPVAMLVAEAAVDAARAYLFLVNVVGSQETEVFSDPVEARRWLDSKSQTPSR